MYFLLKLKSQFPKTFFKYYLQNNTFPQLSTNIIHFLHVLLKPFSFQNFNTKHRCLKTARVSARRKAQKNFDIILCFFWTFQNDGFRNWVFFVTNAYVSMSLSKRDGLFYPFLFGRICGSLNSLCMSIEKHCLIDFS